MLKTSLFHLALKQIKKRDQQTSANLYQQTISTVFWYDDIIALMISRRIIAFICSSSLNGRDRLSINQSINQSLFVTNNLTMQMTQAV